MGRYALNGVQVAADFAAPSAPPRSRRWAWRVASICLAATAMWGEPAPAQTNVSVFDDVGIQFGGSTGWHNQTGVSILDNGRIIERTLTLPPLGDYARVTTQLNIWAQDDHWDRAGNVELVTPFGNLELHKFITGFGGTTSHQQDVTALIPFLRQGPVTIRAHVDTWVPQAWSIDFNLKIENDAPERAPTWNYSFFNDQDWRSGEFPGDRRGRTITIPEGLDRVYIAYLTSGHASDGSGGDEFVQREHKIVIDRTEVFHEVPWRTDGRNFRSVNPWSGRWGDTWSSDFPRSGWIPGDDVDPYVIDVTDYLKPGRHNVSFEITGIEPDEGDGYGYWRTSAYLFGYAAVPEVVAGDYNGDGAVDAADYTVWRNTLGQTGPGLAADGTGPAGTPDNVVDALDYAYWRSNFGAGSGRGAAGSATVPEPSAAGLLLAGLIIGVMWIRS